MTLFAFENFDAATRRHAMELQRERARAELEIEVIMRHGWIEKIDRISDEGLRILMEEKPRK